MGPVMCGFHSKTLVITLACPPSRVGHSLSVSLTGAPGFYLAAAIMVYVLPHDGHVAQHNLGS
jgi:hypothetical protein